MVGRQKNRLPQFPFVSDYWLTFFGQSYQQSGWQRPSQAKNSESYFFSSTGQQPAGKLCA